MWRNFHLGLSTLSYDSINTARCCNCEDKRLKNAEKVSHFTGHISRFVSLVRIPQNCCSLSRRTTLRERTTAAALERSTCGSEKRCFPVFIASFCDEEQSWTPQCSHNKHPVTRLSPSRHPQRWPHLGNASHPSRVLLSLYVTWPCSRPGHGPIAAGINPT